MVVNPQKKKKNVKISEEVAETVAFEEVNDNLHKSSEIEDENNEEKNDSTNDELLFSEELNSKSDTIEVDVKELKDEKKDEKVVIDFMNNNFASEELNKGTKKNKEESTKSETKSDFEGKTIDEVKNEIKSAEDSKNKQLKPSDYEELSKVIVNIIDWIFSGVLKWYAKDSSDTAYSLSDVKKNQIVSQLTLILIKHQSKWSIELMFLFTLIAVYSGPAIEAHNKRKNPGEKRPQGRPKKS